MEYTRTLSPRLTFLFLLIFFGGPPLFLFNIANSTEKLYYEQSTWPSTQGTVISINMTEVSSKGEYDDTNYKVTMEYTYEVDGQEYTNNILQSGDPYIIFLKKTAAEEYVRDHPVGSTISVYYNPDNPQETYIEPIYKDGLRYLYYFGIGWLVLGIIIIFIVFLPYVRRSEWV